MARHQEVSTVFTDDLTGDTLTPEEVETVSFAVDGTTYEIDLSPANASSLRNDIAMWIDHARPTPAKTTRTTKAEASGRTIRPAGTVTKTGGRVAADRNRSAAIRDWAHDHGHTVYPRGRIPATIVEAYNTAH